jgi:hypothetical protein
MLEYDETKTLDDPPGVWLRGTCGTMFLIFFLEFVSGQYFISRVGEEPLSAELSEKLLGLGFAENDSVLVKPCSTNSVERDIFELDQLLSETND